MSPPTPGLSAARSTSDSCGEAHVCLLPLLCESGDWKEEAVGQRAAWEMGRSHCKHCRPDLKRLALEGIFRPTLLGIFPVEGCGFPARDGHTPLSLPVGKEVHHHLANLNVTQEFTIMSSYSLTSSYWLWFYLYSTGECLTFTHKNSFGYVRT